MAIPVKADHDLAKIDQLTGTVMVRLTTMRHSGKAPKDMVGLRDAVQNLVDAIFEFARGTQR